MIFVRIPAQVSGILTLGQRARQRTRGTKLLRELRIGPCSEDRNGGLDDSGDDNLLHEKRVYQ